jgi:hypothetical protein
MLKKQRAKDSAPPSPHKPPAATIPAQDVEVKAEDGPLTDEELLEMELVQQRFQHWSGVQPETRAHEANDDATQLSGIQPHESDGESDNEPMFDEPSDEEDASEAVIPPGNATFSRPSTAAVQQVGSVGTLYFLLASVCRVAVHSSINGHY